MRASTRERERLLGGDAPSRVGDGDKRWSPYEVAWTAGDPWRTWAVPALAALSIYLFLRGQTSAMWVAEGGTDVAMSGGKPSSTVASVSYNLPDTVLELFRSREHLLGERARVSRYPVVARRLRHLPVTPPPSNDALTACFPRIRRRRRARARVLGHLAARQARVRALRLVRSDE